MKVFSVIYYELIRNIRDLRVLIGLLVMPILMILILGTALDGQLSPDVDHRIKTGYVNLDDGVMGKGIDDLFKSDEIEKMVEVKSFNTREEASDALSRGEIENWFVIPQSASKLYQEGKAFEISVQGQKNVDFTQSILNGFISMYNAQTALIKVTGKPGLPKETDSIERVAANNHKLPKTIDYYSVLTLLQTLMLGAILGSFIVYKNPASNMHIRLGILPTSKWTIIGGRVVGSSLFLFISCIVTILFTKFVYKANWDGNLLVIGMTMLIFCIISVGMGILVSTFVNNIGPAIGISVMIMLLLSSASGAISPASTMPQLNLINPNYHAKVLIFGSLYQYSGQIMLKSALGLLAILLAIYLVAGLKLRRVQYDHI